MGSRLVNAFLRTFKRRLECFMWGSESLYWF